MTTITVALDSPYVGDYHFPLVDGPHPDNSVHMKAAIQKVSELLSAEGNMVLVHCVSGISRSATVVIGYLMLKGLSLDEAMNMVKKARPVINPEPDLLTLLTT